MGDIVVSCFSILPGNDWSEMRFDLIQPIQSVDTKLVLDIAQDVESLSCVTLTWNHEFAYNVRYKANSPEGVESGIQHFPLYGIRERIKLCLVFYALMTMLLCHVCKMEAMYSGRYVVKENVKRVHKSLSLI